MSNVQTALALRIPNGAPAGKAKVIRSTLGDSLGLKGFRLETANERELSDVGRANKVIKYIQATAVPELAKARRQVAYSAGKLEKMRADVRTKALGEHDPLDRERRDILRSQTPALRAKAVLTSPAMRDAALRAPDLVEISPDVFERAMQLAINERCPDQSKTLAIAEEAQAIHEAAVRVFEQEIMATPCVVEPNGSVRQLQTPIELENLFTKSVTQPSLRQIALEEVQVDQVEAA
jgi:hypothetical protein